MYDIKQFKPALYLVLVMGMSGFALAVEAPALAAAVAPAAAAAPAQVPAEVPQEAQAPAGNRHRRNMRKAHAQLARGLRARHAPERSGSFATAGQCEPLRSETRAPRLHGLRGRNLARVACHSQEARR